MFNFFFISGEQEFYFSHQLYFKKNCNFLLLLNLSAENIVEDNNLVYWLNFLNSRTSGEMKLVIVGTHADKVKNYEFLMNSVKETVYQIIKKNEFSFTVDENGFKSVGGNAVIITRLFFFF